MPDRLGRVPCKAKVPTLNREVGGDGQIFSEANPQQRAIIADAETQSAAGRLRCPCADFCFNTVSSPGLPLAERMFFRIGYWAERPVMGSRILGPRGSVLGTHEGAHELGCKAVFR